MTRILTLLLAVIVTITVQAQQTVDYRNTLTPIPQPKPILADYPEYVMPILEQNHFEAPPLIQDPKGNLAVRAWRFSYNARGIIEIPNILNSKQTAVVCVHPWGVDDGQGWITPKPNGVAFGGTPLKNEGILRHSEKIINPLLKQLRPHVNTILYSLPGDAIQPRTKAYRTTFTAPSEQDRGLGRLKMFQKLQDFDYQARPIPTNLRLSRDLPVVDYFKQFRGIDSSEHYNGAGYWNLPIPVMKTIEVNENDIVFFDNQGYSELRKFLKAQSIRHILLLGYATDMCVCNTTAGYENLKDDFNVFLVGDATQATHPANKNAAYATNQALSYAALDLLITQVSWIQYKVRKRD
ncbi:MAG: hypothetical protein CMJ76_16660 [Planctomycetaceae bacterium]|nr:hypothetical protein [Planctomycetaceae bacterium]